MTGGTRHATGARTATRRLTQGLSIDGGDAGHRSSSTVARTVHLRPRGRFVARLVAVSSNLVGTPCLGRTTESAVASTKARRLSHYPRGASCPRQSGLPATSRRSRRCGRCRKTFGLDATAPGTALPEWWLCPPCHEALPEASPRDEAPVNDAARCGRDGARARLAARHDRWGVPVVALSEFSPADRRSQGAIGRGERGSTAREPPTGGRRSE